MSLCDHCEQNVRQDNHGSWLFPILTEFLLEATDNDLENFAVPFRGQSPETSHLLNLIPFSSFLLMNSKLQALWPVLLLVT